VFFFQIYLLNSNFAGIFLNVEKQTSEWQLDRRDFDVEEFIEAIAEEQEREAHRFGG
jgi:hypothetical protein